MRRFAFFVAALTAASAASQPGDLLEAIHPELGMRTEFAAACLDPAGNICLWNGFATVNGEETGGILRLGNDGQIVDSLAPALVLSGDAEAACFAYGPSPKLKKLTGLSDGRFIICEPATRPILVDSNGIVAGGFLDGFPDGIQLFPQFERNGFGYFITRSVSESDLRLVRQALDATGWSPEVLSSEAWPHPPVAAIAGPGTTTRVLLASSAGSQPPYVGFHSEFHQQVILMEDEGSIVDDSSHTIPTGDRLASLRPSIHGGYRLEFAPPMNAWLMWPTPSALSHRVEWREGDNTLSRSMNFSIPLAATFVLAEEAGGGILASGIDGELSRFFADGEPDPEFRRHSGVRSILPLPDGKWLLNGARRILANGDPDPTWQPPQLEIPATTKKLLHTADGHVFVAGKYHHAGKDVSLVKLTYTGARAESFDPDPRVGEIVDLVEDLDGRLIVVVAEAVTLEDDQAHNLLRLRSDGSIDPGFRTKLPAPFLPGVQMSGSFSSVTLQPDGKLLATRHHNSFGLISGTVQRLFPDGTLDTGFQSPDDWPAPAPAPLVLADGSFVLRADLHALDGAKLGTIAPPAGFSINTPMCRMPDGALIFNVTESGTPRRFLRRWHQGFWDPGFSPAADSIVDVAPAPDGKLYVWDFPGVITRLHRNGQVDVTFSAPPLQRLARRTSGPWISLAEPDAEPGRPILQATGALLSDAACDPVSGQLWVAGAFNMIGDEPRDGVAALSGANATGYESWAAAALRHFPDHAGPDHDPDGDGAPNWLEYATGSDPARPDAPRSAPEFLDDGSYAIRKNPDAPDVQAALEYSEDLTTWRSTGISLSLDPATSRFVFTLPRSHHPARFARVKFSKK